MNIMLCLEVGKGFRLGRLIPVNIILKDLI